MQTVTMASGQTTSVNGYGKHWYLGTTLIAPAPQVNTIISGSMLDDAGYIIEIMRGTVKVLGLDRQLSMVGYKNESNIYVISRIYPNTFLPIPRNEITDMFTDTALCFITIATTNQSTINPTPVINLNINSNVKVNSSISAPSSNTDNDANILLMSTIDESIVSDESLNFNNVTLSTINDSLLSLHFTNNVSDPNSAINISEELTMNNNDYNTSIDCSILTLTNRLSFDDITPITYVMMIPTAPPLNDVLFMDNEECKANANPHYNYDDDSVYEIGPIDRQTTI